MPSDTVPMLPARRPDPLEHLVERCRTGDTTAYGELYRRVYPSLLRYARRAGVSDLAEDAAQEAFITVLRRLDRYSGQAAFQTWLFRVTVNRALDLARRHRRQRASGLVTEALPHSGAAAGPEAAAEASLRRGALLAALCSLPPDYRAVLYLHYYADLPVDQVAIRVGCAVGTVKSRLYRGRQALGRVLRGGRWGAAVMG